MINFEAHEERAEAWRKLAVNAFLPGIDPADLKVGQRVTISPNLMIHDRAYCDVVHEVVAMNTMVVQTRIPALFEAGKTRIINLMVHEHHFYDATNFLTPGTEE